MSAMWQGHGSAICLEFGTLEPSLRKDGSQGHPKGEFGIMIEWSWRVEKNKQILFGAWDEELDWTDYFHRRIVGNSVLSITRFGQVEEISIELDNGCRITSFSITQGDPQWALFDRRKSNTISYGIRNGILVTET